MKRFVSVWLPHWPIERMKWAGPGAVPDDRPFVLVESVQSALLITAFNRVAHAAGLRAGMRLGDARAMLLHLESAPADATGDARALRELALWCERYGPRRNVDGADGLWIEVTGVGHLFGGEAGLLRDLIARFAGLGLTAWPALADTPGAAWALARFGPREGLAGRIAPAGAPHTTLAALPVEGLRLDAGTLALLRRLGLGRIGQLYDLARVGLGRRFASREQHQAVLVRLDQLLGERPEPLRAIMPAPVFSVRRAFMEPLISSEALETVLGVLADELCDRLARARQGAWRCELAIQRTDASVSSLTIAMSAPSRDPGHFIRLFREKLDRLDAGFGIESMRLCAPASEPLAAGQGPLVGDGRDAARTARADRDLLVDRLRNRLGSGRVFYPGLGASHIPERAGVRLACARARAGKARDRDAGDPPRPPHAVRPPLLLPAPEPIEVLAEVPEGAPVKVCWRRVVRGIARSEGPERIAPEWWRAIDGGKRRATRDYYHLEDDQGARYWVFREGLYGDAEDGDGEDRPRWYMHGFFC